MRRIHTGDDDARRVKTFRETFVLARRIRLAVEVVTEDILFCLLNQEMIENRMV